MEFFEETFFDDILADCTYIHEMLLESAKADLLTEAGEEKGFIASAFEKLKALIKNLINTISTAIQRLTNKIRYGLLSKESKQKYDDFLQFMKDNPQVKKKSITVKDWKKLNSEYDKIEKNIVYMMKSDQVDANGMTLKTKDMIKNLSALATSSTAVLTVDMALALARKSTDNAKFIQSALNNNQSALKLIEDELGKAEAQRLQNKVNKLTKESVGRKLLTELGLRKEKDLSTSMDEIVNSLSKLKTTSGKITGSIQHRDLIRNAAKVGLTNKEARTGAKQAIGLGKRVKMEYNAANAQAQNIINNPVGSAINAGMNLLTGQR